MMDIQTLTVFFMWCSIINFGLLLFLGLAFLLAPNLIYKIQSMFLSISREMFNVIFYSFIGFFKVIVLVFNVVPWIVLEIIA